MLSATVLGENSGALNSPGILTDRIASANLILNIFPMRIVPPALIVGGLHADPATE